MVESQILTGIAYLLILSGLIFVSLSFRSPSKENSTLKLIRFGEIGVIFSLIGGLILILFFYAPQKVPQRIIDEHLEEKYTEIPPDISMGNLTSTSKMKGLA